MLGLGERELESGGVAVALAVEAHHHDALAVLRHVVLRVEDPLVHLVPELVDRRLDDLERPSLVMALEVLHVLEEKRLRALLGEDAADVEEERALRLVLEAGGPSEAVLLGDARDGEGLAREAAHEDVVVGDVGGGNLRDVVIGHLVEVGLVGLAAELVPLVAVNAGGIGALEREAQAADASEEIYESIVGHSLAPVAVEMQLCILPRC